MLQSASVHKWIIRALRWTEGENIHLMREDKNLFPPLSFTSLLIGEKVLMFAFFQGCWDDTWLEWIQKRDFFYIYFLSSATGYLWEEAGLNWREQRNSLMESCSFCLLFFLKFLLTNERFRVSSSAFRMNS